MEGYEKVTVSIAVVSGSATEINVTLERKEDEYREPGRISGFVLDIHGDPIRGAIVAILGSTRSYQTGENGSFVFEEVPSGAYILNSTAEGYVDTWTDEVVLEDGGDISLIIVMEGHQNGEEKEKSPSGLYFLMIIIIVVGLLGIVALIVIRRRKDLFEE
jgi:hypothetical protein